MQNITLALHALQTVMDDSQGLALALMQWFGESPTPWLLNSEIQDLHDVFPSGPLFRFLRYDVRLERDWLAEHLDMKLSDKELALVRAMDNPASIPLAYEVGRRAAEKQVRAEHWSSGAGTASPPL